jgi:pterin-4a-carbinolamine dehydratase
MDLTETAWAGVECNHLARDRDRWRALVNMVMNLAPRSQLFSTHDIHKLFPATRVALFTAVAQHSDRATHQPTVKQSYGATVA